MRLTKVQKALKQTGILYDYREVLDNGEIFGQIFFRYNNKNYMVDEITGNNGRKPSGVYTNIQNRRDAWNQTKIAEAILKKEF